ncbi:hypothetical protein VCHA53O466_320034 [Vibrio chagasii]|nr:hypothetical protein VCHA53O466_320034 [Vibrio chagasii]
MKTNSTSQANLTHCLTIEFTSTDLASEFINCHANTLKSHDHVKLAISQGARAYLLTNSGTDASNLLIEATDLLRVSQRAKAEDLEAGQDWLSKALDENDFGIIYKAVINHGEVMQINKEFDEQLNNFKNDLEVEAKKQHQIQGYNSSSWLSDFKSFITTHWDFTQAEAEAFLSTVSGVCHEFFDEVDHLNITTFGTNTLSLICVRNMAFASDSGDPSLVMKAIKGTMSETAINDEIKLAFSDYEGKTQKYGTRWDGALSAVLKQYTKRHTPINYMDDREVYMCTDGDMSDNCKCTVEFKSDYDRPAGDILYSPESALSTPNLLYSDVEQGRKPMRELVGFMLRDWLGCTELIQRIATEEKLLTVSQANGFVNMDKEFWRGMVKEARKERNEAWHQQQANLLG